MMIEAAQICDFSSNDWNLRYLSCKQGSLGPENDNLMRFAILITNTANTGAGEEFLFPCLGASSSKPWANGMPIVFPKGTSDDDWILNTISLASPSAAYFWPRPIWKGCWIWWTLRLETRSRSQSEQFILQELKFRNPVRLRESRIHEDPPIVTTPTRQKQKTTLADPSGKSLVAGWWSRCGGIDPFDPCLLVWCIQYHIIMWSNFGGILLVMTSCLYTFWLGYFNLFLQCAWSSPHFAGFPRSPQVFSVLFPNFSQTVPKVFPFFPSFPHFSSILTTSSLHFCRTSRPFLGRHFNFARPLAP